MDLMQNQHKLEQERQVALEYRQKFYSSGGGGAYSSYGASVAETSTNSAPGAKVYSPYGND